MVSDDRVTSDRWKNRRRRKEGGRRRRFSGIESSGAAPFTERKPDSEDRNRGRRLLGDGRGAAAAVSARKLAASLWHLSAINIIDGSVTWQCGLLDRLRFEIPKFTTEGATKWDYYCNSNLNSIDLFKARKRVNHELESDKMNSRVQIESEKMRLDVCPIVKNARGGERKSKNEIGIVNSKLVRDIAEAKISARKFMRNLGKEKRARKCLEGLCGKLAKEIKGYKTEIGALRRQQAKILEEADKERKSMQIAEVWREEQAQMKLIDVKLMLENKFAEMNNVIAEFKAFSNKNEVGVVEDQPVTRADDEISREQNKITEHESKNHESSGISSVSLDRSKKKGTSGNSNKQLQRALPRNKDKFKTILVDKGEVKIRINPHVVRAMKGHIEWPRGIKRRGSTEADLLEAKLESQKIITRNVLKQRS